MPARATFHRGPGTVVVHMASGVAHNSRERFVVFRGGEVSGYFSIAHAEQKLCTVFGQGGIHLRFETLAPDL
jgi:hypothetical protein